MKASAYRFAPPLGTALALQIDPRLLRSAMDKGEMAYHAGETEQLQLEGARRINIAATLGLGPARQLIAFEYGRSRLMRMATPRT